MRPRIPVIAALSAAIAACLYFFLSGKSSVSTVARDTTADSRSFPQSADAAGKYPVRENPSEAAEKNPAVNRKRFGALTDSKDADELFPAITSEDIARFLAKHGETAGNLVAAFDKTHDRQLLERALELFPNSPIVLMSAVDSAPASPAPKPGETYQSNPQRMEFIERFKTADPSNPLPWIFSAQELFKTKQTAEGLAEIRAALERPAFYTYANERMDGAQRLYEDAGMSPVEASLLAMVGLTLPHMTAAQQASRSLMEWQKSAADSGDTGAADDAIRLTYDLGRTFATPEASRTLLGQLVGVSMEARALKALPADAQPAWLVVAPAQRLAEMETQKQNVRDLTAGFDWVMQSQNENLLAEYLRRNRQDGELSALTWLKTQRK